jgi:hypothetical protein
MNFQPGDKVVCIDNVPNPRADLSLFISDPLRKDVVYCVDAAGFGGYPGVDFHWIMLVGFTYCWKSTSERLPINSSRFRKVEEVGHPQVNIASNADAINP